MNKVEVKWTPVEGRDSVTADVNGCSILVERQPGPAGWRFEVHHRTYDSRITSAGHETRAEAQAAALGTQAVGGKPDEGPLVTMLRRIQKEKLPAPDSDRREYCVGCGQSPYWTPQHKKDCIVVDLSRLLAGIS